MTTRTTPPFEPRTPDDFAALLAAALARHGHAATRDGARIAIGPLTLETQLEETAPTAGKLRVTTSVDTRCAAFGEHPLTEFLHGAGDTVAAAAVHGYDRWATTDLVALLDAARETPERCMSMSMQFPATALHGAFERRIVFGPVEQMQANPSMTQPGDEDHPFCPCCLFTRSLLDIEDIRRLVESEHTLGMRLFAARISDGELQSDCRINTHDYAEGAEALRRYAATWPGTGLEWRKQYVVIRTVPASPAA
ncbi:MAG TPA: DUF6348 family protein [Tahibacter sp.]|nr:DUF6348 family protein [Tahibacter sp.]